MSRGPFDYRDLFARLNRPPRAIVQPWDDRHPDWRQPPEDPSDQVTDESAARATLAGWALRQQVVAGLIAVEMVVPVWEYWARSPAWPDRTSAHWDDMRSAVREVRSWLREPARIGFATPDDGVPDPAGAVEMDLWVPEPSPTQDVADKLYHAYEVAYGESWVDPEPLAVPPTREATGETGSATVRNDMPSRRLDDSPAYTLDSIPSASAADREFESVVAQVMSGNVLRAIPGRYDARAASRAAYGAWALVDVLARSLDGEENLSTFPAVHASLDAFGDHFLLPAETVYPRWWARVAARLPFADAATCDFEVLDMQTRAPVTS